jgi:hypothetical protein
MRNRENRNRLATAQTAEIGSLPECAVLGMLSHSASADSIIIERRSDRYGNSNKQEKED